MFFRGIALMLGKMLAVVASVIAFTSNFTSCIVWVYQPEMPRKVRMMKNNAHIT